MVEFKKLWYGHPINKSVQLPCVAPKKLTNLEGKVIRPGLPVYANQCAIRTGIALRRAGVSPSRLGRLTTCGAHSPDRMHYIRAAELASRLASVSLPGVAKPVRIIGKDVSDFYPKLFGKTGIVYIKDYWHRRSDRRGRPTGDHIDVWNGYRSSAKWLMEWFSWLGYYSNYAEAKEVWFWEIK